MYAIRTQDLTYRFDDKHGVADLHLAVPAGGVYGFLGPNGAGKTTTIRLLLGLLKPQAGRISLFGQERTNNDVASLAQIGALVEAPSIYPHLSGRKNLEVTRRLLGASGRRVDAALDRVGLLGDAGRPAGAYSLGMRQRLGLALALLDEPNLLILDEPGNGLDPAGTLQMRALIRSLAEDSGITVFLSSHLLGEVEQVATHIGVLHGGLLRYQGPLEELRERLRGHLRMDSADYAALLVHLHALGECGQPDGEGCVVVAEPRLGDAELLRLLAARGAPLHSFHRERPTLESLFFDLTEPRETER